MPLTKSEGLFLSNDVLLAGLLGGETSAPENDTSLQENDSQRVQFACQIPFREISGHALRVERSDAANYGSEPIFDDQATAVPEGKAVPVAALEASYNLTLLVQDFIVRDYVQYNQSSVYEQARVQLKSTLRRGVYKFARTVYTGDASLNANEFSGLRKLTPASRTILPNDTVDHFLDLLDMVRAESLITACRPDYILTSPAGYNNIIKAYHLKGLDPEKVMVPVATGRSWAGCGADSASVPVLSFLGIPVFQEDTVSTSETQDSFSDFTSMIFGCLGESGLCGITSTINDGTMVDVRQVLGSSATTETYRVTWSVGLALKREDAIARLMFRPRPGTLA